MEDELIAMFNRISTNDHDTLVRQFSQIMKTDENLARFFLEAGGWSVENAVHAYLSEFADEVSASAYAGYPGGGGGGGGSGEADRRTAMSTAPSVTLLSDLSGLQATVFPPNHVVEMQWAFRNDGPELWPAETRIVWVDGEKMQGTLAFEITSQIRPGQVVTVPQRLVTPNRQGTFAGTWRLVCPMGYFGDPVWIILTVGGGGGGDGAGGGGGDADMDTL